ncbi:UNVERIFIED_CONTAM: hypothetical protein Slati_2984800 [Sesamum latifolium]|uniref:Retroviral polymerase SH3-like domain-containing protein n=1 Tax=Sesamum latifolium TaxID=2727402 RepID=A0AAW2VIL0_9LAMI
MSQLNGVAEKRNRTLLDMVRSMMSFTEFPPSFWGYALETAASCLTWRHLRRYPRRHTRFVEYPKKTVRYYFYEPSEQKIFVSRNAVFLKKSFPADSRRDEVLLEESSETPQQNDATSFEPFVPTDGVLVLRRSTRESTTLEVRIHKID